LGDGYKLPFKTALLPFHQGHSCQHIAPDARDFLLRELQRCFNTGVLEAATCSAFVAKAFLVPKAGQPGKWRHVLDFRHLNGHLHKLSCRYETLKTLRGVLEQGDYLVSLDLAVRE
jgi:hypothetical protein